MHQVSDLLSGCLLGLRGSAWWALPLIVDLPQVQAVSSQQGLIGPPLLLCPSTLLWSAGPSSSRCPPLPLVSPLRGWTSWKLGEPGGFLKSLAISPSQRHEGKFQAPKVFSTVGLVGFTELRESMNDWDLDGFFQSQGSDRNKGK